MANAMVLVVEDNPVTSKMVRVALSCQGFAVVEAKDAETAVKVVGQCVPDIILQDLQLPDVGGHELLGQLRAAPGVREIPILAFSAQAPGDAPDRDHFDGYVAKPVSPARLVRAVRDHLARRTGARGDFAPVVVDMPSIPIPPREAAACGFDRLPLPPPSRPTLVPGPAAPESPREAPEVQASPAAPQPAPAAHVPRPTQPPKMDRELGRPRRTRAGGGRSELEARKKLEALRDDLKDVIDCMPEGLAVIREGRFVYANRAWARTLGRAEETELFGHLLGAQVVPEDRARVAELLRKVEHERETPAPAEVRFAKKDGGVATVELSFAARIRFEGEPASLVVARDLTETKRREAQLMANDRFVTMAMLAAGVAHEINNPLSSVIANLELALSDFDRLTAGLTATPELEELSVELSEARAGAHRVRHIVRDLRLFSRADEERMTSVDVARTIESALRMAWNEIRHKARLVKEYGRAGRVRANEARLGQVFLNLVVNAAQAIPEGDVERNEIRVATRMEGDKVIVEVQDTGSGMSEEVRQNIFRPFFTTKPSSEGTGLGLAISRQLVTGFGGDISVESAPGKGTRIRVELPAEATSEQPGAAPVGAAPPAEVRRGRILVVDDEPLVARAIQRALSSKHDVEIAASGREALERIAAGDRFEAIVSDLMMPDLSGMDLHREVAMRDGDQARRIVFVTGGAFTHGARAFLERVDNPRIEKPFQPSELLKLVNKQMV